MDLRSFFSSILVVLATTLYTSLADVIELADANIESILNHNDVVFVNFYADWCRFSQALRPIFDETGKKAATEFTVQGQLALGKIDCDRQSHLCQRFGVNKYPTLKLFRFGTMTKREYRGERAVNAFIDYLRKEITDPVQIVQNIDDLEKLDRSKRHVIGYFKDENSEEVQVFRRISSMLRNDCQFHLAAGAVSDEDRMLTGDKLVYKPPGEGPEFSYSSNLKDMKIVTQWTTDKCVPLVREITFENAEELTEEGMPFLILFHDVNDNETPEKFRKIVARELLPQKNVVNFLTADGAKFSHPLFHLGKTTKDLPIIAIDSFKHMYLWKHNAKTDVETPGLLKVFIEDLQSGKLHREFHHGPDQHTAKKNEPTTPPESTFKKLAPSKTRYTLLRDEL